MSAKRVFVVDDDRGVRFVLAEALREAGYAVQAFEATAPAYAALREEVPALVFTDVRMPGGDGLAFLERVRQAHPDLPVVVMSAYTDMATTAGAFRGGAHDYLPKPFDLDHAVGLARQLAPLPETAPAMEESVVPVDAAAPSSEVPVLVGESAPMRELFRQLGRIAQLPLAVLVTGETGTGKELVARALHAESPRAAKPFVALNTAAIPAELLESELFGHEAGAFTGATRRHIGRFEQADGGSLFLDEIGDMPAGLQTRLLRVLAEGEFFRVGGRELIRVDVRVIAATHQDLARRVAEGAFREDLLHRLDVLRIALPPLRERREDVVLLAGRFLAEAAQALGQPPRRLEAGARRLLQEHPWPGNVRELRNLCWRLAALVAGERIDASVLRAWLGTVPGVAGADWTVALRREVQARLGRGEAEVAAAFREAFDATLLQAALDHHDGHRQRAAEQLGLGRNTLARKLGPGRRGRKPG